MTRSRFALTTVMTVLVVALASVPARAQGRGGGRGGGGGDPGIAVTVEFANRTGDTVDMVTSTAEFVGTLFDGNSDVKFQPANNLNVTFDFTRYDRWPTCLDEEGRRKKDLNACTCPLDPAFLPAGEYCLLGVCDYTDGMFVIITDDPESGDLDWLAMPEGGTLDGRAVLFNSSDLCVVRWNPDPRITNIHGVTLDGVTIERVSATSWEVTTKGDGDSLAQYVDEPSVAGVDHGTYFLPFKITVTLR